LKPIVQEDFDKGLDHFIKLMQVMQKDSLINEKVIQMLRLDSYQRRSVLNVWLEQLRNHHASQNLLSALFCLFDDKIADKVLTIINDCKN